MVPSKESLRSSGAQIGGETMTETAEVFPVPKTPEETQQAISSYIESLATRMSLPEGIANASHFEKMQQTIGKLESMVELDDRNLPTLELNKRGHKFAVNSSALEPLRGEINIKNPDVADLNKTEALSLVTEAAARYLAVAESEELGGKYRVTKALSRAMSRRLTEKAVQLANDDERGSKRKRILVGILPIILAACANAAPSPDIETTSPTQVVVENTEVDPTNTPELQPTAAPSPEPTQEIVSFISGVSGVRLVETGVGLWEATEVSTGNVVFMAKQEMDKQYVIVETDEGTVQYEAEQLQVFERNVDGFEMIPVIVDSQDADKVLKVRLKESGEWATPLDLQRNPENIDEYIRITPEDVWSGLLAASEALQITEPFPDSAVAPDGYIYSHVKFFRGSVIVLSGLFEDSQYNYSNPRYVESVTASNEYRRWVGFSVVGNESGEDIIVGTMQMLKPDGKTVFIHMLFGFEVPREAATTPAGDTYGVVESIFKSLGSDNPPNDFETKDVFPVVYFQPSDPQYRDTFFGLAYDGAFHASGATEIFDREENTPFVIDGKLETTVSNAIENSDSVMLSPAPDIDFETLQKVLFMNWGGSFHDGYFD